MKTKKKKKKKEDKKTETEPDSNLTRAISKLKSPKVTAT